MVLLLNVFRLFKSIMYNIMFIVAYCRIAASSRRLSLGYSYVMWYESRIEGKGGACVCVYVGFNGAVNRAASVANVSPSTSKYPSSVRAISLHIISIVIVHVRSFLPAKLTIVFGHLQAYVITVTISNT